MLIIPLITTFFVSGFDFWCHTFFFWCLLFLFIEINNCNLVYKERIFPFSKLVHSRRAKNDYTLYIYTYVLMFWIALNIWTVRYHAINNVNIYKFTYLKLINQLHFFHGQKTFFYHFIRYVQKINEKNICILFFYIQIKWDEDNTLICSFLNI